MDDLACHGEVVDRTLSELDFINRWLGGNAITMQSLYSVLQLTQSHSATIADLGCGSGEMLRLIDKSRLFKKFKLQLLGYDANPNIIAYALKHNEGHSIQFKSDNVFDSQFQKNQFDVVMATLFLHHFTHHELVHLIISLRTITSKAIIINDLHRHPLAYYSIKWLTSVFSKSAMVKYDAPLSVARGFKKSELLAILKESGCDQFDLKWKWAFRWQLIVWL